MQIITLTIKPEELLNDINEDSYIIGQSRAFKGEKAQSAYHLQSDDDSKTKLLRSMQLAVSSFKTKITPFVHSVSTLSGDNTLVEDDDIVITLSVSDRFNTAYTKPLAELAHKYIMNTMLFDWFNATAPEIAKTYFELTQLVVADIANCFVKNPPTRS